ncbi:proton-conducting transporter membrane subunit [Devosia sp. 1635]|uniref:proton-conducting transporter transmembrane domain-containing protein n=1 Tax=Devosia sp. 1635 TaxID=2726066 RepID=UPI0015645A7F|nr:proton-conducting transporter membrane subunit [Devosia sp. 1635]
MAEPFSLMIGMTPASEWMVVLPLVLALMGSAFLLVLRRAPGAPAIAAMLVVIGIIVCEITLIARILREGPVSMTMGGWQPPFGISFTADLLGAGFALAAAIVALIVLVYAEAERDPGEGARDGFHALVLLLLGGVTGSFLTGDLFNLYVWFEVMLIASFGLLVLGGKPLQLDAAVKYGFLNIMAASFFLLALGLLHGLLGTLNMADIIGSAPGANPAAMTAVAALLMLAFAIKGAAFPVNAWLPASYHAPSAAVSALLGGLLTKVGVFALLRTMIVLLPGSYGLLQPLLATAAIASLVLGPLGAIAETNLRRAIGFMLIGGIGAVLAGIAMPTPEGIAGAGLYIFHAIFTLTGLYLVAGMIERRTGQTDTRQMGGLYAASTPMSILFFLLVLAVAGVPPLLGFWPKLLLLQAATAGFEGGVDPARLLLMLALLGNAVLTLIAGTRIWAHVFWRGGWEGAGSEHQNAPLVTVPRRSSLLTFGATGALVVLVVAAGLWPNPLLDAARIGVADMTDPQRYIAAVELAGEAP